MRESDYPKVHRRWVAVMVILLLSCLLVSVSVCESADVELGSTSGIWVAADIPVTGLYTNEIRWGGDAGYGQSGYSVDGTGVQSFNFDEPFLVGTFWHFNWPIYAPSITWADLEVTLHFNDPPISPDPTFTIKFEHEETPNIGPCYGPGNCPNCPSFQQSDTPCDDRVTFPFAYPEETFVIGDKSYTLKIIGFTDSWPGGTPVEDFITEERKDNHAYLIGTLSSVLIPEPQINITKQTSDDNATWDDANDPPGPYIPVGDTVYWRYIVQNTGNEPMTDITVMDDNGTSGDTSDDFVVCSGFALDPGDHTYCYATGTAVAGQYGNIGTVTGYYSSSPYSDTDPSHYFGCSPSCTITAPEAVCELSAGNSASTIAGYSSYTWALSAGTITAGLGTDTITWTAPSSAASPVVNISVTVVDSNGCTNTCYTDVTVYELPSCTITAPEAVCELSAGNSASTIAGYSSYTWALSAGTITAGLGTDTITWTAPSSAASPVVNISVTVVDSNGCTNTCYTDVTVYELPSCTITAPEAVCELSAGNSASTIAGYSSYTWALSAGTITAGLGTDTITWTAPSSAASPVVNISVTVVDSNGCTNTCYTDVTVYELPSCTITAPEAVCELSAGNSASTIAGYSSYTWALSAGTITAGLGTDTITWTAPSSAASPVVNISVTVVDSNGCTNTCYTDVTVYELPSCTITAPEAVCELSAGNSASTIAGYSSYTWALSAGTITAGLGTDTITWTAPSSAASPVVNISVTVVDSNGCTNTCYTDVTVYELPSCTITAPEAVCELSAGNSASTIAGYSSYTWALSAGTITAGLGTDTITWTAPSSAASPVVNISVTVVDSNGCTNTCYTDVTVYELPSCTITAPEAVCELSAGNSASTIAGYSSYTWALSAGTITAGLGTDTITWTAPSSAASPVVNISVTVVDSNGCTNTCYTDVTVYELPSCTITAPEAVCELSAGNSASTIAGYSSYTWALSAGTITAGLGTDTITWTAPSSAASPVVNISVTVVDSNGCTNTCYTDVTVYELPSCTITAPEAVCELSAGNSASTIAGYSSYTWALSAGTITAGLGTDTITWTAPSSAASPVVNISVTVVDSNGCTNTCYTDVTVYELPSCTITAPEAVCELSAGNSASTIAGYSSYTWALSAGTITAGLGTDTITWTAPSSAASPVVNISVTVVDSNGCTNTCYTDVTVYELPSCTITAPEAVCELSAGNSASTIAGYSSYTWALSAGTITAGLGTDTITWTAPSSAASPVVNISVTVVDSNGCTNTCYTDVTVYELPSCTITAPEAVCELSAGNSASTIAGYSSYTWALSAGTITAGLGTDTITWTAPSSAASPVVNISVTVVDSNGCTNTCYTDVTVYELPSCTITAPEAVCELSAGNSASTIAGYSSYTWALSAGTITAGLGTDTITWTAPSSAASPVVNISVTVVDSNGCTNTCYTDVTVYELPSCTITAPEAVCELSAGNSASTIAGYSSYTWALSAGTITAGLGTDTITWTAPSSAASPVVNISVTVVDSNGCTNTCYTDVTVYELPSCTITAPEAVCELSAGNSASTIAGYSSYTWALSAGTITAGLGTDTITWTAPSSAASPVVNISVTVVDSNGCTNTCYTDVTVYELPSCTITAPEAVCELSAGNSASTIAGYSSYTWALSAGTITAGLGTDTITWTAPSSAASPVVNISVTVVDSNGCTNTCYTDVTVYELPSCTITAPEAVCELSAGNSASTIAGYSSYTWALSAGTITAGLGTDTITWTAPSSAASPVVNISVTVVDSNGCTNTCYTDVTVYELPSCTITAPEAVCELSAGNSASTIAGYSSYTWALSAGTITAGLGTDTITWTAPSSAASPVVNISVTVVDSNGCTNTCYTDVTVYELPSCTITAPEAVCELSAGNSASTIAGYSSYTWALSAGTITAGLGTDTITWTAPSSAASPVVNISVTVVDSNGCTNTCYTDVTVYELPSCTITAPEAVCELSAGNSASTIAGYSSYTWALSAGTITAGLGTDTITWTAPSSAASPVVNISVTVVDSNGCTNTCYTDVTVYELPSCTITAPEAVCELSAGNSASTIAGYSSYTWALSAGTITAGLGTDTITWTAPSSAASPVVNISVTVVDSNGCTNTCYTDVTVYELPSCTITAPEAVCELSAGNSASTIAGYSSYTWALSAGTITAGLGTDTITWTAPSSAASPVVNISVTVVDSNGCTNTCYTDVTVYELPSCTITAPEAVCELSAGNSASTIAGYSSYTWALSAGTITAGLGTDTITWTAPSSAASPVVNISVTVVDSNGCTNTCYTDVTVYELPSCTITAPEAVCELSAGNSASTIAGYSSYTWALSAGTITAGLGTDTITWTAPSAAASPVVNISVTVVDSNGCTNTCYTDVTVYELPSCTITAPEAVCELSAGNSASTIAGYSSYTWALSAGTITAGLGTDTITWTAPSSAASPVVNISVTVVDSNGCTNTCYTDVTVYELPSCTITAPEAVCELSAGNSASTIAGYSSYTWALSAGTITAGLGTDTITWTAPSSAASPVVNISVTVVDSNGCTNTCYTDVTVYELPSCTITAPEAVCELSAGNSASTIAGYSSYTWALSAGTITAGLGTDTITWTAPSSAASPVVNISVTVVDSNGCTNTCYTDVLVYSFKPSINIIKTASLDGTCPGSDPLAVNIWDTVTYCFNVTNTGDVTLTDVSVSDDVYGPVTNLDKTTLAPGESAYGTINHVVVETDVPTVTDTATATGTPPVGAAVTGTDECTINVAIAPGISVTKTADPTSGAPSTDVTFTITVTNTGDCTLNPVMVVDTLPSGMSYVSDDSGGSVSGQEITWNLGSIASGAPATTISLVAHIDTGATGTLTDTVTATGTPPHGDDVSGTDTADVTALTPGISVTKTADPTEGPVGTDITFTIIVTNTGDCTLNPVRVTDELQQGLSYVSSDPIADIHNGIIIWENVGPLTASGTAGDSTTITLVANIDEGARGVLNNTVHVEGKPHCGDKVTDDDIAQVFVLSVVSVELEKTSSPAIVAPGGNVTYTINYTNTGDVPLHNVVITEHYPDGVTFISASPAPDAGTNNVWTIGTLLPGESGTIVIKVKVPEQIDLYFTETGSVIGEGLVMVTKDLSTEQKPYSLRNSVTLSCTELDPESAYATTKVSGVPGTSLGITESGSGVYSSDEILDLQTKNRTIILEKSTHAEYKPTSFNFSDSFSVNFTNKWKQDICSRNMEIDAAIHKKISDATYIDDETISRVDKDKSVMLFDSSFNGSLYIGARTKEAAISETYIGEFDVLQTIHIGKGPIPTPMPTPTPTPIWLPCPFNASPEMNMTEEAEPTP